MKKVQVRRTALARRAVSLATIALVWMAGGASAFDASRMFDPEVVRDKPAKKGGYVFEPALEIGGPEAAEPAQFYEKLGNVVADADAKGNIYVLDNGNHRVQVFGKSGTFLRSFGAEGQGPGEFQLASRLSVNASGACAVFDMAQQRISLFDASGKLLHDRITPRSPMELILLDDRSLLLVYDEARPTLGEVLDPAGNVAWQYGVAPPVANAMEVHRKISMSGVAPLVATDGRHVFHASDKTYCVRVVKTGGEVLESFARPFERTKFDMQKPKKGEEGGLKVVMVREQDSGQGGVKRDVQVGDGDDMEWKDHDMKRFMPEFMPDIRGVVAWPDGRLWVATSRQDDDTMTFDEWNAKAELLRTFEVPASYDGLRVGRDGVLYAVGHDEDDFPIVYRVLVSEG